jgi:hypothetical protein
MPTNNALIINWLWRNPGVHTPASVAAHWKVSDSTAGKALRDFAEVNPDHCTRLDTSTYLIGPKAEAGPPGPTGDGTADLQAFQQAAQPQPFSHPDPYAYSDDPDLPPATIITTYDSYWGERDGCLWFKARTDQRKRIVWKYEQPRRQPSDSHP